MFVLDRRVTPATTPAEPATSGPPTSGTAASDPAMSGTAGSGTAGSECWRVEATPGRSVPPATYELCHDLASGRWLLSRA
jgi:hypothetical protein